MTKLSDVHNPPSKRWTVDDSLQRIDEVANGTGVAGHGGVYVVVSRAAQMKLTVGQEKGVEIAAGPAE